MNLTVFHPRQDFASDKACSLLNSLFMSALFWKIYNNFTSSCSQTKKRWESLHINVNIWSIVSTFFYFMSGSHLHTPLQKHRAQYLKLVLTGVVTLQGVSIGPIVWWMYLRLFVPRSFAINLSVFMLPFENYLFMLSLIRTQAPCICYSTSKP